ncbi:hypothetical protein CU098_007427, partial [Rhizopus stolonifer]
KQTVKFSSVQYLQRFASNYGHDPEIQTVMEGLLEVSHYGAFIICILNATTTVAMYIRVPFLFIRGDSNFNIRWIH